MAIFTSYNFSKGGKIGEVLCFQTMYLNQIYQVTVKADTGKAKEFTEYREPGCDSSTNTCYHENALHFLIATLFTLLECLQFS